VKPRSIRNRLGKSSPDVEGRENDTSYYRKETEIEKGPRGGGGRRGQNGRELGENETLDRPSFRAYPCSDAAMRIASTEGSRLVEQITSVHYTLKRAINPKKESGRTVTQRREKNNQITLSSIFRAK